MSYYTGRALRPTKATTDQFLSQIKLSNCLKVLPKIELFTLAFTPNVAALANLWNVSTTGQKTTITNIKDFIKAFDTVPHQ